MASYIVRRIAIAVPVLILISIIAFSIVLLLPGDAALAILGEDSARDEVRYQALREQLGLDRSIPEQYIAWVDRAVRGNFGISVRTGEEVGAAIARRLAPTFQLTLFALLLAVLIGIPVGVLSAVRSGSAADNVSTVLALSGVAIPNFWLGILLIFLFSVWLGWLPPSGYVPIWEAPLQSLRLMIMPAIALSTGLTAVIVRQVRSAVLEVLSEDYIKTARSKGLPNSTVIAKHALRNALIPVVTVIGMQIGRLFGGTVTIELIFSIPGMGRLAVDSIFFRDFPMLQGIMLVIALAVLLANLLADIAYALLDARIRYG